VGLPLVEATLVNGISWFSDGSGFIASDSATLLDSADLYLYDFETQKAGRLTSGDGFAVWPSVSPDGASVAYTYSGLALSETTSTELRIRDIATGDERALVVNGLSPDWR
jgi:Tol biopolymer transport system component